MPRPQNPAGGGPPAVSFNNSVVKRDSRQSKTPKSSKDHSRRTLVNGLATQPPLVRGQDPSPPTLAPDPKSLHPDCEPHHGKEQLVRNSLCFPLALPAHRVPYMAKFPVIESDAEPGDVRALWNRGEKRTVKRPNGRTQPPLPASLIDRTGPLEKTGGATHRSQHLGDIELANCYSREAFSCGYKEVPYPKETLDSKEQKIWVPFQEDEDGLSSQVIDACIHTERIFRNTKIHETFLLHRDGAAQRIVDALYTLSKHTRVTEGPGRFLLAAMLQLSWESNLYPTCLHMPDLVQREQYPVSRRQFGDIYKGSFRNKAVCIEYHDASQTPLLYKAFAREAMVWNQLSHANILPFYGIDCLGDKRHRIGLVSPWMKYGTIDKFLKAYPDANRHSMILDVVAGLTYLHSHNIVHGNLSPANIFVNDHKKACIAGFDLVCIAETEGLQTSDTPLSGGATRFEAPELVDPDCESSRSKASDIYAFGMVCYQILTGNVPFPDVRNDFGVIMKTLHGEHPPRPNSPLYLNRGLTDSVWDLMVNCWQREPKNRPDISQIARQLLPSHETDGRYWADLCPSEFLGLDCHASPSMSVTEAFYIVHSMAGNQ